MNRRTLLHSATLLALGYPFRRMTSFEITPRFTSDPFAAGVASGDPTPRGIVLWTRLISDATRENEWQRETLPVEWEIASDENMRQVVKSGRALAVPEYAHSVHVEVNGLAPNRWYWYRFKAGTAESVIGRTKTAPASLTDRIRFAFASCQNYESGYFTAYQNMIKEDVDVVVFLGDYIYENRRSGVRPAPAKDCVTLGDYRDLYGQHRSDKNLQEAHRLFPWIITWDDHEVENNYASAISENNDPPETFLKRRAAAYQAHYEWLPMPKTCIPQGPDARVYRRLSFGPLANFIVLDGRQYRSDQPCGDGVKPLCEESLEPGRTMLGPAQEKWLDAEFRATRSRWNIVANQVRMTVVDQRPGPQEAYAMDQWAGYDEARRRFITSCVNNKVTNPVVITGDIHSNWVGDLKLDYRKPNSPVVAAELIGTSITSGGDGADSNPAVQPTLAENPQIKFYNSQRGYVRCEVKQNALVADFRVVQKVSVPESAATTRASFIVEAGKPGAHLL